MLRPTFLGFETAKRGLTAAQKGLDIAGQNLTNWDSAGYTRQRITQVALAPDSYRSRYATSKVGLAGQGVEITGIDQTRDVFLDKRFREENGDLGYYGQAYTVLADIQASINEFNPDTDVGLRSCLLSLNEALQDFASNAYSETHANIVMTEFKNLTQTLQQISSKLQDSREQQIYDLEISVGDVNKKLQQIAGLNQAIMEDMAATQGNSYFGPNELLDQRNLLLDELSQYMDLQYENNADGTVTVTVNGQTVISGSQYDKMELMENPETGVVDLRWISSNESVNLTTGALKASGDYTNGRGPTLENPGESPVKGFLYYQDKLNTFAQTLADTVNNIIPEVDENGEIKTDPATGEIVYRKLLGAYTVADDGSGHVVFDQPITADNLSISDEWSKDPSYIIFEKTEDGDADNEGKYALALSQTLIDGTHGFDSNGEVFQGTFLDYVKGYVSTLAEDVSFAENRHTAASTVSNSLQDSRDQVSGVVVDEEVANVMLYQKSLSAASRLMTAMDEALDVLINKTGLVGR